MDIPWDDLRIFLAVAEARSLSAAARRLRIAQPTVSRRVAELEAQLGEPLFTRGVEGAALTPYGERLFEPARRMAECSGEVARAAEKRDARPAGTVRLTAPPGVAYDFVAPFALALRARLPEVRLEVVSTLAYLDLVRREADLALRMKRPTQRDLLVLAELETGIGAFASPAYRAGLHKRPAPADVDWICWAPPLDHLSPNPELAALIPGFRPAFASDDFLVQLGAAQAGVGAVVLGRARHRELCSTRELVELDLDLGPVRGGLFLVAARGALEIPRVRAVADELIRALAQVKAPAPRRR
jgi:DNA-binding transcriptional LysR family regulator